MFVRHLRFDFFSGKENATNDQSRRFEWWFGSLFLHWNMPIDAHTSLADNVIGKLNKSNIWHTGCVHVEMPLQGNWVGWYWTCSNPEVSAMMVERIILFCMLNFMFNVVICNTSGRRTPAEEKKMAIVFEKLRILVRTPYYRVVPFTTHFRAQ